MTGAVKYLASDLLYHLEEMVVDASQQWILAYRRSHDWQELYPSGGSELQKTAYARVEAEIREELLSLEEKLAEVFASLHRARSDIAIPHCPACWVEKGERVVMEHELDYRYDRTDNNYSCRECGERRHSIESGRYVG